MAILPVIRVLPAGFRGLMNLFGARSPQATGWLKLGTRFMTQGSLRSGQPALVLTQAEEAGILAGFARVLIKLEARVFLGGVLASTVRSLITGESIARPLTERIEIVGAQIVRGASPFVITFSAVEQAAFAIHDFLTGREPEPSPLDSPASLPADDLVVSASTSLFNVPESSSPGGMPLISSTILAGSTVRIRRDIDP